MPKRNKIELQGLVERIVHMFYDDKMTHVQIAEKLKSEGFDVSKSGVGRTLVSHASQMKAYRDAAAEAVEIVKEVKKTPGLDINEATIQIASTKLLKEIESFENFNSLEPEEVLKAVSRLATSQTQIAKVKLEYERGYKKGLFEAAKTVEEEIKKAGWDDERVAMVKAKIMGLKVKDDDEREL